MPSAKLMSRWVSGLTWALVLFLPAILVSFLSGFPGFGLALSLAALVCIVLTIGLATYSLLSIRCSECEQRFFSITYPVWPFESSCANCGTAAVNAASDEIADSA